ncbi:hypothetical protein WR25_04306 [Diploscapter pachys]|uniref:Protein kinase domain-containing protein n=1 Tax=Diploscapter pachys TaxID=2018661 RepID=A0A2A2LDF6_9BILA|nr:hypothetical protein WR25_04306 [Diploscapter pachys]
MAQQLVQLMPGQQVERWTIEKKLGEGGFGAVYRVYDATGRYALKVEGVNEQIQVLKLEVHVLTELTKRSSRHFCKIEDKGRFGGFNYVVMTLVGKSLENLVKSGPGGHMTLGCSLGVGIQALEALEDLHQIGYLHRDVKPGNYAIGRPELNEIRKVYILDFGMCRKFTNDQVHKKYTRQRTKKDDCESWLYMQIELTGGRLPWHDIADMKQVGRMKQQYRASPFMLFTPTCPTNELAQILRIFDGLKYYDAPPYQQVYGLIRSAMAANRVQEFPYDWEPGMERNSIRYQNILSGPSAHMLM